jgi:hypothetical protein
VSAASGRDRVVRALWVVAFCGLALLPFGTVPYGLGFPGQHDLAASDLLHAHLPYRAFLGERLAAGSLPQWWPDVFSGAPLLAQVEAGTFYLPQWPFYALLDPYLAFDLSTAVTVLLGAAGAWLWARSLGASPAAAAFAGIAFAGCGWNVSHVKHPSLHASAAWVPWVLWALERALDRHRPLAAAWPAAGALLAIQALAGMPQVTWMLSLVFAARVAIAAVGDLRDGERRRVLTNVAAGVGAGGLGLGAAAVQLVPTALLSQDTVRPPSLTPDASTRWDMGLEGLATFVYPKAAGAPLWFVHVGDSVQWENYAFCGVAALLLAAVALVSRRTPQVWIWAALGAGALVLSAGGSSPVFDLAWAGLPGFRVFRFHQRWLLFVQLAICGLAAVGLDVVAGAVREGLRRWIAPLAAAVVAAEITVAAGPLLPVDPIDAWRQPGPAEALYAEAGEGRIFMMDGFAPWYDAYVEHHGLRDAGSAPLVARGRWPLGSMPTLLGRETPSGYINLVERRVARLWMYDTHNPRDPSGLLPHWRGAALPEAYEVPRRKPLPTEPDPRFAALLSRAGVRVVTADHAASAAEVGWEAVGDAGGLHVWRNPAALPRAYVASRWVPVADADAAIALLHGDPPADSRVPAIETAEAPAGAAAAEIAPAVVREPWPERVEVDVEGTGGWLVLTDTASVGWTATVDGAPTAITLANAWQRAVRVEPGEHRVVFEYRTPGLRGGAAITALCAASLAVWAALSRLRGAGASGSAGS